MPGTTNGREWTMADIAQDTGYLRNRKLKKALLQHRPLTSQGLSERLFRLIFSGLVCPPSREDQDIAVEAMAVSAAARIVPHGLDAGLSAERTCGTRGVT